MTAALLYLCVKNSLRVRWAYSLPHSSTTSYKHHPCTHHASDDYNAPPRPPNQPTRGEKHGGISHLTRIHKTSGEACLVVLCLHLPMKHSK